MAAACPRRAVWGTAAVWQQRFPCIRSRASMHAPLPRRGGGALNDTSPTAAVSGLAMPSSPTPPSPATQRVGIRQVQSAPQMHVSRGHALRSTVQPSAVASPEALLLLAGCAGPVFAAGPWQAAALYMLADQRRLRWSCGHFDDLISLAASAASTLCSGTAVVVCHPSRALLFAVDTLHTIAFGTGKAAWDGREKSTGLSSAMAHRHGPSPPGLTFAPHGQARVT